MTDNGKSKEREFETMSDEFFKDKSQTNSLNLKRTYDEYQHESLESIRRNRSYVDRVLANNEAHDENVRQISVQALQNAVETANMVGKNSVTSTQTGQNQTLDHRDLGHDRQWNVDEQTFAVRDILNNEFFRDSLRAVVVDVISELSKEGK